MNAQGEKEGLMIRIAVCDDQEIVCENVRKMILHEEEDRYEVDLFRSGKELLEAGRKYDILFLDIDMPGMDGIMTAKEIRKTDKQVEIIYSNFAHRFCLCTLKIQYLAGIRLSKFTLCPMPPEAVSSTKQAMCS